MTRLVTVLVLSIGSLQNSWAPAGAVASLRRLIDEADVVAIADLLSGTQVGTVVRFTLVLDRVLKGNVQAGAAVFLEWDSPFIYGRSGSVPTMQLDKRRGLWFLKYVDATHWRLLPANVGFTIFDWTYYPIPPGDIPPAFAYSPQTAPAEKVILELTAATEYFDGDLGMGGRIVDAVHSWSIPAVGKMYQRLSESPSRNVRVLGLAGLLRLNDASAMARVEREIDILARDRYRPELALSLEIFRNPEPQAVKALGRIATGTIERLQLPAAFALSAIHNRDTLPFLGVLLNHPSQKVREQAVCGFSAFTANLPITTFENSKTGEDNRPISKGPFANPETERNFFRGYFRDPGKEAELLNFWKNWWEAHRGELVQ